MAIGDKQVEPAIIVVIEESPAKTQHVEGGDGDAYLLTDVPKPTFSVVVKDVVRIPLEIGDKQVEPAIVIVVAQKDAHGCHSTAKRGETHPRNHPDFGELPVVFVVEEINEQSIIG